MDGPTDGPDEVTANVVAAAVEDVAPVSTPAADRLRDPEGSRRTITKASTYRVMPVFETPRRMV